MFESCFVGSLRGGGSKGNLVEPWGASGKTRECWGILKLPSPLGRPSLKDSIVVSFEYRKLVTAALDIFSWSACFDPSGEEGFFQADPCAQPASAWT